MSDIKTTKRTKKNVDTTNNVATDNTLNNSKIVSEAPIIPKKINEDDYVTVHNGHHGILVYKSRRTGEVYTWEAYGDEQEIQIRELKDAKNSNKKFFINNWFVFDEDTQWVIDYLGMRNFYKNAIGLGKFDDLFKKKPDEIKSEISQMSKGQKDAVGHRAHQLICSGEIDSRKCIAALEEALGVELIEK